MTYNGETFNVQIELGINLGTGEIYATFHSIDPKTDLPPDALAGFLPPEDGTGRGTGYFDYTIDPNPGLPTGTQIRNVALITFDGGQTVATDLVDDDDPSQGIDPTKQALVTIDAGPPTSTISSLPTTTSPTFTVNWSGTDVAGGSGIASYNIYVSDDGGPFTEFQAGATATSATFTGQVGHTYGFYSVAIDNVGNIQPTPASAQQTIQIVVPLTIVSIGQVGANPRNSAVSTISVGLSEAPGPQSFNYEALTLSDNGGPNLITSAVTVTLSATDSYVIGGLGALTAAEGEYTLTVNAADILDPYGNPGIGSLSASWLMDTTPPTSTVNPLPAQMISTSFTVSVTASDPSGANTSPPSGVASIAIYVLSQRWCIHPVHYGVAVQSVGTLHRSGGEHVSLLQRRHRQRRATCSRSRHPPRRPPRSLILCRWWSRPSRRRACWLAMPSGSPSTCSIRRIRSIPLTTAL